MRNVDLAQFGSETHSPLPSFAGHTTDFMCGFQAGVAWLALVALKPGGSLRITVVRTNVPIMTETCDSMGLTFAFEPTSPPVRNHVILIASKPRRTRGEES